MTAAGQAIYRHVAHLAVDADTEVLLRALSEAGGTLIDRARRVALGDGALRPGQLLWDPAAAELWALRWTAQLTGAAIPGQRAGETDAAYLLRARDAVIHVFGWHRGTPEALRAILRGRLTGGRRTAVYEQVGSAWRAVAVTYEAETPNPVATAADLQDPEAVPAGVRLIYRTDPGWSVGQLEAAPYASIGALEAAFTTVDDLERHLPA